MANIIVAHSTSSSLFLRNRLRLYFSFSQLTIIVVMIKKNFMLHSFVMVNFIMIMMPSSQQGSQQPGTSSLLPGPGTSYS